MYIDKQNTFSTAQAVTAAAGSTDYIDLGAARDLGNSDVTVMITVDESATAVGDATVDFQVQVDDNASFSSPETIAASGAIGKAALTAGREAIYIKVPPHTPARYMRVYYDVGTGPLTAGKFSAAVVEGIQRNRHYPDAL